MTAEQFVTYLFKKVWVYIIHKNSFEHYWNNDEDREYNPADFYSDEIPELIKSLQTNFQLKETYEEVVGTIDPIIRPTIMNFMAWLDNYEHKSGSDIYNLIFNSGSYNFPHLEEMAELVACSKIPQPDLATDNTDKIDIVFSAIDKFTSATKSLVTRRNGKKRFQINDEYDIQDILHVMLKPFFPTLRIEEVVSGNDSGKFLKIDFVIGSEKIAIECKFIRDATHANSITKEINDDIQTYHKHQDCHRLIFFLYDKNLLIKSPDNLEDSYTHEQKIKGKRINLYCKVRPKN